MLIFGVATAQKATLSGVVTDLDYNNESLPAVSIVIKGTNFGTTSDINGKYSLDVNPGNHILVFNFMGYTPVEVSVSVKAGEKKTLNQGMKTDNITLEGVTIEVVQSREKESALLMQQQKAVEIKQNIGAQELSRKGVGDVATAVAKTSGVSKQEGSNNVYVRGLGDRYNSTSINGLPVPSNDPEKKNIDLNLFSTDIVEYISIDKVYTSKVSGDFAGGNVDITSKNYRGSGMFEIGLGGNVNTNALEKADNFLLQDGPDKFGYSSYGVPNNPLTGFRFQNSMAPVKESPYGGNLEIKAGKSFSIGEQGKLNLFATANFDNGFQYREGINQSVSAQGAKLKSFEQEKFSYTTNTTGMFNAGYVINDRHKLSYNLLFVNSSDQSRDIYRGFLRDIAENDNGLVQRSTYIQNTLFINQLLGKHTLTEKIDFDWGASFNTVKSDMPDRIQNTMKYLDTYSGYVLAQNTITDNNRYYQNLTEDEMAANLAVSYKLGNEEISKGKITLGYNGRFKQRDFEAIQFNFRIPNSQLTTVVDPNNLDTFFNQQNYQNGLFTIESFAGERRQTYTGEQNINAGFASLEYKLSDKWSSIVGLRFERVEQTVEWVTQLDPEGDKNTFNRNEFLPNLVLKYELTDSQNFRFGASKTYTLPQFKERALFIYEDVTEVKVGNPDLYPSQNYNVDLKWEMFPKNDEVISATLFGKYIVDPINEVTLASSTNDISFLNTGDSGYVYGAEIEVRKNIFDFESEHTNKLSAGLNVSYMQTHQELDSEKVREETNYNINLTDDTSSFTGASDLLLNADVSYTKGWGDYGNLTATMAYSYYSDRLYALGIETKGNLVDKGMGTLDFILKTKLSRSLGVNFTAKNILNPEFRRMQENTSGAVPALTYKKGSFFGLGVSYEF
ncbi:MAG: TonB-dependent receptor [Flavobacteriaceae bacterium]